MNQIIKLYIFIDNFLSYVDVRSMLFHLYVEEARFIIKCPRSDQQVVKVASAILFL